MINPYDLKGEEQLTFDFNEYICPFKIGDHVFNKYFKDDGIVESINRQFLTYISEDGTIHYCRWIQLELFKQ